MTRICLGNLVLVADQMKDNVNSSLPVVSRLALKEMELMTDAGGQKVLSCGKVVPSRGLLSSVQSRDSDLHKHLKTSLANVMWLGSGSAKLS